MSLPTATYRLQLRAGVSLADAENLVPYLHRLGISHLYLSPLATAAAGSGHGYDVVDPNRVAPDLGGEPALASLAAALHARGMGLIADIVPNHMATAPGNVWWQDVLAGGQGAAHARFFDVDWAPPRRDLAGKVLLPVLGRRYGQVLESGELRVEPGPVLAYLEHRFPLAGARPGELEAARANPEALHRLLRRQAYRLAFWRTGLGEVNYRRFFDVSGLVGVRVEDAEVFAATHAGLLRWAAAGLVDGVRVDHIDGLWDPAGYLRRLAAALPPGSPLWVEKVLAPEEELPTAWPCAGTTGYELGAAIDALLYDGGGAAPLDLLHAHCGAPHRPYAEVLRAAKREALEDLFPAEVAAMTATLAALAPQDRAGADLGTGEIRRALLELTAWLPVYRTYAEQPGSGLADAVAGAARALPAADGPALDFVARVLAGQAPAGADPGPWRDAAARWRQLSGPAMAKGGEDTALYRHVRLTSLNEVGADPDTAGLTPEAFHAWCARRLVLRPGGLSATSTHDSKRSEDVRARIHVLAEIAGLWSRHCARWRAALGPAWADIDPTLALLLLQAAIGAWPPDPAGVPAFAERLGAYALKAAREARRQTAWMRPEPAYEARVARFVGSLFASQAFLDDFLPLQKLVAFYGAVNSLAQVVLKAACPGVPDLYQGCETWSLSLVDPDNRRAVDFPRLEATLADLDAGAPDAAALFRAWPNGRVKHWVTAAALRLRRAHPRLFAEGAYVPVPAAGRRARHLCCFLRHAGPDWVLAVVPRFPARLTGADRTGRAEPPLGAVWEGTRLSLPPDAPTTWHSVLTGAEVEGAEVARLLSALPVALLAAHVPA